LFQLCGGGGQFTDFFSKFFMMVKSLEKVKNTVLLKEISDNRDKVYV